MNDTSKHFPMGWIFQFSRLIWRSVALVDDTSILNEWIRFKTLALWFGPVSKIISMLGVWFTALQDIFWEDCYWSDRFEMYLLLDVVFQLMMLNVSCRMFSRYVRRGFMCVFILNTAVLSTLFFPWILTQHLWGEMFALEISLTSTGYCPFLNDKCPGLFVIVINKLWVYFISFLFFFFFLSVCLSVSSEANPGLIIRGGRRRRRIRRGSHVLARV